MMGDAMLKTKLPSDNTKAPGCGDNQRKKRDAVK